VNHDPKLIFPLSLHDQTHTNKCLDNFFAGPKVYSGLKQESQVMPDHFLEFDAFGFLISIEGIPT
jgi:truncated hemoglobin YjbI